MPTQAFKEVNEQSRLESFDAKLLDQAYSTISGGLTSEGLDELLAVLRALRLKASPSEWAEVKQLCLQHRLRELLHHDPFTSRAFAKPRGYAGDAVLLDYVYARDERWCVPEATSAIGRKIFDYTTRCSACEAVRAHRGLIADVMDELVEDVDDPHVLSVGAGHLREALLCAAVKRRKLARYVALDWDEECLQEIHRCYGPCGVETVRADFQQVLGHKIHLGLFNLVYSTGLYHLLPRLVGQRFTWALFQMLRSRGRLLLANFLPGIPEVGYMESFMDWVLIYRTRQEMLELCMPIPQAEIRRIKIFTQENQNLLLLELTKW